LGEHTQDHWRRVITHQPGVKRQILELDGEGEHGVPHERVLLLIEHAQPRAASDDAPTPQQSTHITRASTIHQIHTDARRSSATAQNSADRSDGLFEQFADSPDGHLVHGRLVADDVRADDDLVRHDHVRVAVCEVRGDVGRELSHPHGGGQVHPGHGQLHLDVEGGAVEVAELLVLSGGHLLAAARLHGPSPAADTCADRHCVADLPLLVGGERYLGYERRHA